MAGTVTPEEYRRPNVLLIVADDLGEEVGVYGDPVARTPHLDRFAERAVRFTNAYVTQASCSPSRSSILTGLWPHQSGQVGLSHLGIEMDSTYHNLFSLLKAAEYRTGILGKLHVAPRSAFPLDYGLGGFDTWISEAPEHLDLSTTVVKLDGSEEIMKEKFTRYHVPVMADTAAAFIRRSGDRPFFLMMNYLDPHRPFRHRIGGYPARMQTTDDVEPPAYLGEVDPNLHREVAGYYNGVARFDDGLGEVMDMLDSLQLWDSTLVIVLGDHGAPLPRAKMTVYEAGLRIPFMVHFPGDDRSLTYSGFVSTLDILPTVAKATRTVTPAFAQLPGRSLQTLLQDSTPHREYQFGEYTQHLPEQLFPQRSVRDGRYKLVWSPFGATYRGLTEDIGKHRLAADYQRYAATPEYQLFDLREDPQEFENRISEEGLQSQVTKLKKALARWQADTRDPLLQPAYQTETKEAIEAYVR